MSLFLKTALCLEPIRPCKQRTPPTESASRLRSGAWVRSGSGGSRTAVARSAVQGRVGKSDSETSGTESLGLGGASRKRYLPAGRDGVSRLRLADRPATTVSWGEVAGR